MNEDDPAGLPVAVAEVVRLWLARAPSAHTRRAYLRDVSRFIGYSGLDDLDAARLVHVVDWRDDLSSSGLSAASVARMLNAVKSLSSFAFALERTPRNFALLVRPPKIEALREERILPFDYVAMLFGAARNDRDRALLRVLYYSGIRCAECAGLRWRSLAVDARGRGILSVMGKGERRRYVLIPAFLFGALARLRGSAVDDAPMWRGRRGALTERAIHAMVARTAKRAHIPGAVSPHWLRHAHVSHALDGRAPIALVQRDAGHASLETTGRYAHSRPDDGSGLYLPVA